MSTEPSLKGLRVAYAAFEPFPNAKGSGTRMARLLEALAGAGAEVTLFTLPGRHVLLPVHRLFKHVPIQVLESNFLRRGEAFRERLAREFVTLRPDVIHYRGIFEAQAAAAYARQTSVRRVFEVNGLFSVELDYHYPEVAEASEFQRKLRLIEAQALVEADLLVTQSVTTRSFLLSRASEIEARCVVVPNAAEPTDYPEVAAPERGGRARLLYAGTLAPWQGVAELLMAVRRVARSVPVSLTLAGPMRRSWKKQLERVVRKLDIVESVRVLGPMTRVALALHIAESDVCVAPLRRDERNSRQGCSPLKLFEYMAAGRPIVSTDLPCVREIVEHERSALLATSARPSALAEPIVRLLENPVFAHRLGREARERVRLSGTWAHRRKALLDAYRKHLLS
ncbi:MAG TPA: glycosyltransferase family 4 protein [Polyangiaceae bacterium]|nr:glycosyltransferase family 4 protein [Polyangiaceae bacterium]